MKNYNDSTKYALTEGVSNEELASLMKAFISQTMDFYHNIEEQPVCRHTSPDTLARLERTSIPKNGRPFRDVYEEMQKEILSDTIIQQHPRCFSCIPSTMSLISWFGDIMTNAYNPHASCHINAPAASLVEKKLIRWFCDLAGFPRTGGGVFVSGGSIANLTALTAARDALLSTPAERQNAVVYVSEQTHSSVAKALHIIGFYREQIRTLPTDETFRMDIDALKSAIAADLEDRKKPFAVIASAGTTNTGSVDPIPQIASLCRQFGMWLHVDGAFGAAALLSERRRELLSGIELSDSFSLDAHKWLRQTYGCSMVLVRDEATLIRAFAAHPEYLKDAETISGGAEFWDYGPELTRPARSLKLWLTLQTEGSAGLERTIDHGCEMAEFAEQLLRTHADWEIISSAHLGIVTFRYVGNHSLSDSELDQINHEISREITNSGFAQIFTTSLHGKTVLRMCTINPSTTKADIRETILRLTRANVIKRAA